MCVLGFDVRPKVTVHVHEVQFAIPGNGRRAHVHNWPRFKHYSQKFQRKKECGAITLLHKVVRLEFGMSVPRPPASCYIVMETTEYGSSTSASRTKLAREKGSNHT